MPTIGTIIETTTAASTIFDPTVNAMVDGPAFFRRHYDITSCGETFTVQSVYKTGDYDLIVSIHGGRDFLVGTDETPTIDDAVAAAIQSADTLGGLKVGISERLTSAAYWAQTDRTDAQNAADFPLDTMPR